MAENSLAPGFFEVKYTFSGLLHRMRIPVLPVAGWTVGLEPSVVDNGGNNVTMGGAMTTLLPFLRALFANTTDFVSTDAWFYPAGVDNPVWVYNIAHGLLGTNAGANVASSMHTVSFRTSLGGIAKVVLMESVVTVNSRNSYPFGAGSLTNLVNWLIGAPGVWRGRDGGKLVTAIWSTTKTSDAIRKIRLSL